LCILLTVKMVNVNGLMDGSMFFFIYFFFQNDAFFYFMTVNEN